MCDQASHCHGVVSLGQSSVSASVGLQTTGWNRITSANASPSHMTPTSSMAATDTGKTPTFALPLLQLIEMGAEIHLALILVPTRESAAQVAQAAQG